MTILLLPQPALAQERQIDLTLRLFSRGSYNEVIAGKDNSFYLEISNIGNKAIADIKLSSDKPEGWVIDFKTEKIDYLSPGSLQTIDVNIKSPENVSGGEYGVNIIAEANEIRKVEKFWVTVKTTSVKTTSLWLWVGAGVVLAAIIAFVLIYRRFGRQKSGT